MEWFKNTKRVLGRFKERVIYMMRGVYKKGIDPRTLINV